MQASWINNGWMKTLREDQNGWHCSRSECIVLYNNMKFYLQRSNNLALIWDGVNTFLRFLARRDSCTNHRAVNLYDPKKDNSICNCAVPTPISLLLPPHHHSHCCLPLPPPLSSAVGEDDNPAVANQATRETVRQSAVSGLKTWWIASLPRRRRSSEDLRAIVFSLEKNDSRYSISAILNLIWRST